MYGDAFCKVYNEFGWNYFPEAFGGQLLDWINNHELDVNSVMDLGCGTGVLCEVLTDAGIEAWGMDFSESMINVAHERNSARVGEGKAHIHYEVGDMIIYEPGRSFDIVTCTGDALNHIMDLKDVGTIFKNVYSYTHEGGFFIFDILSEEEVPDDEPFDLDFSDSVKAKFHVTRNEEGIINLNTSVFEDGEFSFEENIRETVHDIGVIRNLLIDAGFEIRSCSHELLENAGGNAATWYVIAHKRDKNEK